MGTFSSEFDTEQSADKYIGDVCYGVFAVSGTPIPIDAANGTLPDGTTYTVANALLISATDPGDIRYEDPGNVVISFSSPVEVTLSPTNDGDVGNPIMWQDPQNGTPSAALTDGGNWVYTPGIIDAQIDTSGQTATGTLDNPAVRADDPWGTVVSADATTITLDPRDTDAVNVSVRVLEISERREAYGCMLFDGSTVYRDKATDAIVTIDETNFISRCDAEQAATTGPTAQDIADAIAATPKPDQGHVLVQGTGSVPAGLKSVTIKNLTGETTINGGYPLIDRETISFAATEEEHVRPRLPAYTLAGGTWHWIGLEPVVEV